MSQSKSLKNKIKTSVVAASLGVALIGVPASAVVANGNDRQSNGSYEQQRHGDRDNHRGWWGQKWWWQDDDEMDLAACAERQESVDQAIERFTEKSEAKHAHLALYLENQQAFVGNNTMQIDNYDRLNARANTANINAAEAIEALDSPDINCDRSERNDDRLVRETKQPVKETLARFHHKVASLSNAIINNNF